MKKFSMFFLTMLFFVQVFAIPMFVPVQGRVNASGGTADCNRSIPITFSIYNQATAGNCFWRVTRTVDLNVVDTNVCIYSILLGDSGDPLLDINSNSPDLNFVGVKYQGNAEGTPRVKIGSTPYAYISKSAGNANTLDNNDSYFYVNWNNFVNRPSLDYVAKASLPLADANVADNITLTNITQVTNRSIWDLQNLPATWPFSILSFDTNWLKWWYLSDGNIANRFSLWFDGNWHKLNQADLNIAAYFQNNFVSSFDSNNLGDLNQQTNIEDLNNVSETVNRINGYVLKWNDANQQAQWSADLTGSGNNYGGGIDIDLNTDLNFNLNPNVYQRCFAAVDTNVGKSSCDNNTACKINSGKDANFSNGVQALFYVGAGYGLTNIPWASILSFPNMFNTLPWADANVANDITLTDITQITNRSIWNLANLPSFWPFEGTAFDSNFLKAFNERFKTAFDANILTNDVNILRDVSGNPDANSVLKWNVATGTYTPQVDAQGGGGTTTPYITQGEIDANQTVWWQANFDKNFMKWWNQFWDLNFYARNINDLNTQSNLTDLNNVNVAGADNNKVLKFNAVTQQWEAMIDAMGTGGTSTPYVTKAEMDGNFLQNWNLGYFDGNFMKSFGTFFDGNFFKLFHSQFKTSIDGNYSRCDSNNSITITGKINTLQDANVLDLNVGRDMNVRNIKASGDINSALDVNVGSELFVSTIRSKGKDQNITVQPIGDGNFVVAAGYSIRWGQGGRCYIQETATGGEMGCNG